MNYKPMKYVHTAALAGFLALNVGCATLEDVDKRIHQITYTKPQIDEKFKTRDDKASDLERRVENIRTKTHIGVPLLRGQGFNNEYGEFVDVYATMAGIMSNKFNDTISREHVRERSNMIVLHTTNDDNLYYGMAMVDNDKSGNPSRGDRTISDGGTKEDEKMVPLFASEIPAKFHEWLINKEHIRR